MHRTIVAMAAAAIMITGMVACSGPTSRLDDNWGRSYMAAKHNQILNPDTGRDLTPVEGRDGQAVEKILERYRQGGQQDKQKSSGIGVLTIQQ